MVNKVELVDAAPFKDWALDQLGNDRELAIELLRLSFESMNKPDERGGALLALRYVVESQGGIATVARQAGISREALYRSLSPKGNPTLKTLLAVLGTVGVRLSIVPLDETVSSVANDGPSGVESRVA